MKTNDKPVDWVVNLIILFQPVRNLELKWIPPHLKLDVLYVYVCLYLVGVPHKLNLDSVTLIL